jgi:chromosome transmission fidelity protein 4
LTLPSHVLCFSDRQAGQPGAIITQLAFCPTQNVLSWTDDQGLFSRWQQPIPDTLPSPVKVTLTGASTISVKKRSAELSLFGEDADPAGLQDIAMEDLDDDWIIDDIGGQMGEDGAESKSKEKAIVKEMGKPRHDLHLYNGRTITLPVHS